MSTPPIRSQAGPAPNMPTPEPRARSAEERSGERFADLFAARRERGAGRPGQARSGRPSDPSQVAEIFNEHGLLGRGITSATKPVPPVPSQPSDSDPHSSRTQPSASAENRRPSDPLLAAAATLSSAGADSNETVSVARQAFDRCPVPMRSGSQPVPPAAAHGARPPATRSCEPVRAGSPAPRPQQPRPAERQAGAAGIEVTVHAGAEGVSLVARTQKLSRLEQARLKTAIAVLLAHHGLSAQRIVLNGESGSPDLPGG